MELVLNAVAPLEAVRGVYQWALIQAYPNREQ